MIFCKMSHVTTPISSNDCNFPSNRSICLLGKPSLGRAVEMSFRSQALRGAQSRDARSCSCRRTRHRSHARRDRLVPGIAFLRCFSHSRSACSDVAFTNAPIHPYFSSLSTTHHHSFFTKPQTVAAFAPISTSDVRPCPVGFHPRNGIANRVGGRLV
jgi:hypothetical protein